MAELTIEQRLRASGRPAGLLGVIVCVALLSLLTVFVQVKHLGLSWHETEYRVELGQIAAGNARAPEVHRPLSAWLASVVIWLFETAGIPRSAGLALIAIRLGQSFVLFLLILAVYRRLGIPPYLGLLGLSVVAWGMTQSHDASGLAIDVYTEMILYLIGAWALVSRHSWCIVLLSAIAALNRETSILIPVLLAFPPAPERDENTDVPIRGSRPLSKFYAAITVWFLLRCAVYLIAGPGIESVDHSRLPLSEMVGSCLLSPGFWAAAAGVFGIVPIIALLGWRAWPPVLRNWFWLIGPVWLVVFLFLDPANVHHVWMLPQVLVLVPGLLLFIVSIRGTNQDGVAT